MKRHQHKIVFKFLTCRQVQWGCQSSLAELVTWTPPDWWHLGIQTKESHQILQDQTDRRYFSICLSTEAVQREDLLHQNWKLFRSFINEHNTMKSHFSQGGGIHKDFSFFNGFFQFGENSQIAFVSTSATILNYRLINNKSFQIKDLGLHFIFSYCSGRGG